MPYKIDKNIPPPAGKVTKWPFINMGVNDSVFFRGEDMNGRAMRAARAVGMRHDKKFVGRLERGGIRIWRTA